WLRRRSAGSGTGLAASIGVAPAGAGGEALAADLRLLGICLNPLAAGEPPARQFIGVDLQCIEFTAPLSLVETTVQRKCQLAIGITVDRRLQLVPGQIAGPGQLDPLQLLLTELQVMGVERQPIAPLGGTRYLQVHILQAVFLPLQI